MCRHFWCRLIYQSRIGLHSSSYLKIRHFQFYYILALCQKEIILGFLLGCWLLLGIKHVYIFSIDRLVGVGILSQRSHTDGLVIKLPTFLHFTTLAVVETGVTFLIWGGKIFNNAHRPLQWRRFSVNKGITVSVVCHLLWLIDRTPSTSNVLQLLTVEAFEVSWWETVFGAFSLIIWAGEYLQIHTLDCKCCLFSL